MPETTTERMRAAADETGLYAAPCAVQRRMRPRLRTARRIEATHGRDDAGSSRWWSARRL